MAQHQFYIDGAPPTAPKDDQGSGNHEVPKELNEGIMTGGPSLTEDHSSQEQKAQIFCFESKPIDSPLTPSHDSTNSLANHRPWRATLYRLGPLSGVACMILAVLSILVSLGILLGSDGVPVEKWTIEPSAILAICSAVANQAMRFAAFQGLMIAWWYGALRGSTIEKLHIDWRAGTTVAGALSAGRRMGWPGLACIFSTLVAVDGPLLQKATSVVYATLDKKPFPLTVSVLPEIPSNFFSGYNILNETGRNINNRPSYMFNRTIPTADHGSIPNNVQTQILYWLVGVEGSWLRNDTMSGSIIGCRTGSHCKLKVRAPALAITACTSYQVPVDYYQPASDASVNSFDHASPFNRDAFLTDISFDVGGLKEKINLVTGFSRTEHCKGVFNYTACTLEAAVADYDVVVRGDTVTSLNARTPHIISLSNNTRIANNDWNHQVQWYNSTLAGIQLLADLKWRSGASFSYSKKESAPELLTWGPPSNTYEDFTRFKKDGFKGCVSYLDPKEDIIEDMNRLMFYAAHIAGSQTEGSLHRWLVSQLDPGLKATSLVDGWEYDQQNVYRTDLRWFGAAIGVELLCIALVLPTFIGWWKIGRPVSFSPIEIAKAFDAPSLTDCNSNSSGRDIAKEARSSQIRYGSTVDKRTGGQKLVFADPAEVQYPQSDSYFLV